LRTAAERRQSPAAGRGLAGLARWRRQDSPGAGDDLGDSHCDGRGGVLTMPRSHDGSQSASAMMAAEWLEVARTDGNRLRLALGLQWHTVLGRDPSLQARRRARALRARYWVHAGG